MSLHPAIVNSLLRLNGNIPRRVRWIENFVNQSPAAIRAEQDTRLSALLYHAYRHTEYYRRVLAECGVVDSGGRVRLDNFHRVPILEKSTIQTRPGEIVSDASRRRGARPFFTSGTTGQPARVLLDRETLREEYAANCFLLRSAGVRPGDPSAMMMSDQRDIEGSSRPLAQRIKLAVLNRIFLNCFHLTDASMRETIRRWNAKRPDFVWCYAITLYEVARFAEANDLAMHSPRAIFSGAESLYPSMRECIERVLRAKVTDTYGSREMGHMTWEPQPGAGMRIMEWKARIEIVDENDRVVPDGEPGQALVTCLTNFSMPFIRYRMGDRARVLAGETRESGAGPGAGMRRLDGIVGRLWTLFRLPDGSTVDAASFAYQLFQADWIRRFQLVQRSETLVEINLVTEREIMPADRETIAANIRKVMGLGCAVEINRVQEIPLAPSGKRVPMWSATPPPAPPETVRGGP